jgi:hypothetical protein
LKLTPAEEAAAYMRTGIDTSPKEIVPDPIECGGMKGPLPAGKLEVTKRFAPYHGARYASKRPRDPLPLGVGTEARAIP